MSSKAKLRDGLWTSGKASMRKIWRIQNEKASLANVHDANMRAKGSLEVRNSVQGYDESSLETTRVNSSDSAANQSKVDVLRFIEYRHQQTFVLRVDQEVLHTSKEGVATPK